MNGKKRYTCNQVGHFKKDCPNKVAKIEKGSKELTLTISQAMIMDTNSKNLWINSGAKRHITKDKYSFLTFH